MISVLQRLLPKNRGEKRLPGYGYKLSNENTFGLDVSFPEEMSIDEGKMSVVIPFADGNARDGVGDLLEIGGIRLDRHRKNPIVLFDHGKQTAWPVALAEDPQTKQYTVQLDPLSRTGTANCFFYRGTGMGGIEKTDEYNHATFCEQLFDLIAKKFVRAGSIGYQIIKSYPLPPDPMQGLTKGLHLLETLMLELSAVVLPANGDTVRKMLSMPSCCGKPLSPYLVKSLEPYAAEKKVYMSVGTPEKALYEEAEQIFKLLANGNEWSIDDLNAELNLPRQNIRDALSELLRSGRVTQGHRHGKRTYILTIPAKALRLKYRTKDGTEMNDKPSVEDVPGEASQKEVQEPFGAQTLRQVHADHKLLMEDYDRLHKLQDHPKIKKFLEKKLGMMDKDMSEVEGIWKSDYAHLPELEGAMGTKDESPAVEADSEQEELPPAEEAPEAMREEEEPRPDKEKSSESKEKTLRLHYRTKAEEGRRCGQYHNCRKDSWQENRPGKKSVCPKCGKMNCSCKGMKIEEGHEPGKETERETASEPGSEYHGENEEGHTPGEEAQLEEHEMKMVGEGANFLKDLSQAQELTDEHRMDAHHYHKTFAGMASLEEANDKVDHNLGNHEVPPPDWEAGVGAHKSQPSSGISPEKAKKILKDGEVRGHKLTSKQEGMFGAAAGRGKKELDADEEIRKIDEEEGVQPGDETEGQESHRKMCGKAAGYFKEISTAQEWSDQHREKAAYWHRSLSGMMHGKGDMAEGDAAVREMGSMKSLKESFAKQNEAILNLTNKLAAIGVN